MEALNQVGPAGNKRHILSFKRFMTMHGKLAYQMYDASTVRLTEKFRERAEKRQRMLYRLMSRVVSIDEVSEEKAWLRKFM